MEDAGVTSQWKSVQEFAAMFKNDHKELSVIIYSFNQPSSVKQIPGSRLGKLRRIQQVPACLEFMIVMVVEKVAQS